jgi:hypothetical protein
VDTATLYELIGYLASALVVLSLLMSSVLKLRIIGLIGASVFATYGGLIGSIPVLVTNGSIVLVHAFHLRRLLRDRATDAYFEIMRWPTDGIYLPRFVAFHADDIARSQPSFEGLRDDHLAWVILRDAEPVGLVLARHDGSGTAQLDLDYVVPEHRDFAAGSTLYTASRVFEADGITQVVARADTETHRRYLIRMGFEPDPPGSGDWSRPVG